MRNTSSKAPPCTQDICYRYCLKPCNCHNCIQSPNMHRRLTHMQDVLIQSKFYHIPKWRPLSVSPPTGTPTAINVLCHWFNAQVINNDDLFLAPMTTVLNLSHFPEGAKIKSQYIYQLLWCLRCRSNACVTRDPSSLARDLSASLHASIPAIKRCRRCSTHFSQSTSNQHPGSFNSGFRRVDTSWKDGTSSRQEPRGMRVERPVLV